MNIYEYQAKDILRKFGVEVPKGRVASDPAAAESIARDIGGKAWAVKAQILAGGRGKAGGIKIVGALEKVKQSAQQILGISLKTHQSGESGRKVNRVLVEQCCDIARELYLAITIDRLRSKIVVLPQSPSGFLRQHLIPSQFPFLKVVKLLVQCEYFLQIL